MFCNILSFILNTPYTLIGLIEGLISFPESVRFNTNPYAFVFRVKNFWWGFWYFKHARAMTIGSVVLLGPLEEKHDLEHELIHVRQYDNLPIIYPIFYYLEMFKYGYRKNKYEDEAYRLSGSIYRGK